MVIDTELMTASDWTAMAIVVASFLLFANTAADLATSLFGRRVTSNVVRRLRAYDKEGLSGRSHAGATMGVFLLIVSQVVPVAALITGVRRDQPLLLLAGTAEVIGAIAVVIAVVRGTTADSVGDHG